MTRYVYRRDARAIVAGGRVRTEFTDGDVLDSVEIETGGAFVAAKYLVTDTRLLVRLPSALGPAGGRTRLRIGYHYTVPKNGGRTGWTDTPNGEIYDIAQWYPRMAVYDDVRGWDPLPYLGNEFYLEYGAEGDSQAVWRRDQPQGSWRRRDLVAARALRQERGSSFDDEIRSGRRTDALQAVRRQCGVVGAEILAFNLTAAMKGLVLDGNWATKRMKALRFHLIRLPGRVVSHARKLIIRLGGGAEALATILDARRAIRAPAQGPAG